jgi:hypothetical protein
MSVSFAPKFEKEKGAGGKQLYTFHVQHAVLEEEGALLTPADIQRGGTDLQHLVWNIPEGVKTHTEEIMRTWLQQCSSVFTTPPPLEKCLANTIVLMDNTVKIPTIDSEEEDKDWTLWWKPTRIQIDIPKFILYWAPVEKKENTRIREDFFSAEEVHDQITPIVNALEEVKLEEFRPIPQAHADVQQQYANVQSQHHADVQPQPHANVQSQNQADSQLQKDMARVIGAYEKARHFYEKAENYNEKFKKKYGFYAVDEDGSETSSFRSDGWTEPGDDELGLEEI